MGGDNRQNANPLKDTKRQFPLDPTADTYSPLPAIKMQRKHPLATRDLRLTAAYLPRATFQVLDGPPTPLPQDLLEEILSTQGCPREFSIDILAAAIAEGCRVGAIREYLDAYPRFQVEKGVQELVKNCSPVFFYALERNDVDLVHLLLESGCDANCVDVWCVPALAFTVMRSKWTVVNPTACIKTLLGFGAQPEVVPSDMWENYLETPSEHPEKTSKNTNQQKQTMWCEQRHRKILSSTLNLSIRYFLYKASQITVVNARGMQLAQAHDYVALLKVPYLVVGQTFACKFVIDHVTSHIGMNITSPLVLTFAGLSGHGKTELAKQVGQLLQVPMTVVDCAQMRSDTGLFGSRSGYHGNERGSQLNNHLTDYDGERSVVFLDEFDKTDQEVRNSLLLVLDSGEYHDRRTNLPVDASKTIWILATNLGDKAITKFYSERMEGTNEAEKAKIPHKLLQNQLKALFRDRFGAPMAGRMRNVAPFYPFSEGEQAVVAHKFLMDLVDQVRQPIDLSPTMKRYPGHVHLEVKSDGKLCLHIAKESYITELGARSLTSGIDDIRRDFYTAFVDSEELVHESMNEGPLMKYTVRLAPVQGSAGISEVNVSKNGYTEYYKYQGQTEEVKDTRMHHGVEDLSDAFGRMLGEKGANVKAEDGDDDDDDDDDEL